MNPSTIHHYDQSNFTNTIPNQKEHCCIHSNRHQEKIPVWEQDYLLIRKIAKVATISIVCIGALFLFDTLGQKVFDHGYNTAKQIALDRIENCKLFKEGVIECITNKINWM